MDSEKQKTNDRSRLLAAVVMIALVIIGRGSRAQDARVIRAQKIDKAINKACAFLIRHQQEELGVFGTKDRLAITSMATLALMSTGSTPQRGPYSKEILNAVRWTRNRGRSRGHFWDEKSGYSQIHNHGYALLLLTQVYGESGQEMDRAIARKIRGGIRASAASQHPNGGFGYFLYNKPPANNEMMTKDEASTTISQIQALRGARNAGFEVPSGLLNRAERYIFNSQHKSGGFVYSLGAGRISFIDGSSEPTFAITAASACVLNSLGTYRGPKLDRAIDYLADFKPPTKKDVHFFYYGHYYAAQVLHQIGGERWRTWRKAVVDELLKRQRSNGSFPKTSDSHMAGLNAALMNTAWAIQIMNIENGLLPIFER